MGKLLAEHGHAHRDPRQDGLGEGGPNAQPVDEVVDAVPEDDHPGHGGDLTAPAAALQRLDVLHGGPALGMGPVNVAEGGADGGLGLLVDGAVGLLLLLWLPLAADAIGAVCQQWTTGGGCQGILGRYGCLVET